MGIQPIDLQTLYTQLDKVGKLQGDARQTFAAEFEKSQQANKEDAEHRQQAVQKTEAAGEERIAIHQEGNGGSFHSSSNNNTRHHNTDQPEEEKSYYYIQDPLVGKRVDISG